MSTLFIMLEFGIIFGSFLGALVYDNQSENFKYAFLMCSMVGIIAFVYLSFIKRDKIHIFKI